LNDVLAKAHSRPSGFSEENDERIPADKIPAIIRKRIKFIYFFLPFIGLEV